MVSEALQNNGDPNPLLKQVMSGIQPEQKQIILQQAKQFGCPENILSQIQNMK